MAQLPGTLFLPTSTTLLTPVHSENDSRVYSMIVLTADYRRRSRTCRIAARYKFHVDWLIDRSWARSTGPCSRWRSRSPTARRRTRSRPRRAPASTTCASACRSSTRSATRACGRVTGSRCTDPSRPVLSCSVLFFSRPRYEGWPHTMDVLSPFIPVLCHSD